MIAVFQSQLNCGEHDWKDVIYNKYVTIHLISLVCNGTANSADI